MGVPTIADIANHPAVQGSYFQCLCCDERYQETIQRYLPRCTRDTINRLVAMIFTHPNGEPSVQEVDRMLQQCVVDTTY